MHVCDLFDMLLFLQLQLSEVTVSNFDEAFGRVVISLPREGHAVPVQVAASSYHAAAQETRYYEARWWCLMYVYVVCLCVTCYNMCVCVCV